MAATGNQDSTEISSEVDWDKVMKMMQPRHEQTLEQREEKMAERKAQSKQAWIDPRARREMAREKAKDPVVAESKPPKLTAEEKSKKLTELHENMSQHVRNLVIERDHKKGPDRSKERAKIQNLPGAKMGRPKNLQQAHRGPMLSSEEHEASLAAQPAANTSYKERSLKAKAKHRMRKKGMGSPVAADEPAKFPAAASPEGVPSLKDQDEGRSGQNQASRAPTKRKRKRGVESGQEKASKPTKKWKRGGDAPATIA